LPARVRALLQGTGHRLATPAIAGARVDGTSVPAFSTLWLPFIVAAIAVIALFAGAGRILGAESASLQWNMHLLTTHMVRAGSRLSDPTVVIGGAASSVAFADSLLLSVLKLLIPGAWPPFFGNIITLLSVALLLYAGVGFLQALGLGRSDAVVAIVLFALLPVGLQIRFAAPFDLSVALLAVLLALSERASTASILTIAFVVGLVNTANGYEYAALVLGLRFCNLTPPIRRAAFFVWSAVVAVAGSIVASALLHALSPATSLREIWWFTEEIPRIVWAESLPLWWLGIAAFIILSAGGLYGMVRQRAPLLHFTLGLAIGSLILALPTRLGGIPLVSPADLLRIVAPQGWPSARFIELLAFALTIPVAYAVSILVPERRPSYAIAVNWVAAVVLFIVCVPSLPPTVLPSAAQNAAVVEFPIAEAHSRAGVMYAEDLLAAKAHIVQPLPFLDAPSPLLLETSPTDAAAVKAMRDAGVRLILLREDIYAKPAWRTVGPHLPDPALSAIPNIDAPYPWKVITYIPAAQRS